MSHFTVFYEFNEKAVIISNNWRVKKKKNPKQNRRILVEKKNFRAKVSSFKLQTKPAQLKLFVSDNGGHTDGGRELRVEESVIDSAH